LPFLKIGRLPADLDPQSFIPPPSILLLYTECSLIAPAKDALRAQLTSAILRQPEIALLGFESAHTHFVHRISILKN
jgi:hypothetical protein